MKNTIKISVILIMILTAGNFSLYAQRGMRGMRPDSARMDRMRMGQGQMPMMRHQPDSSMMRRMQHGMVQGHMRHPGMAMNQAPGIRIFENIPNLSDKQKKEIANIRQKQQDEMQKLRTEMMGKMNDLRESDRSQIMNLLDAGQKKRVEENAPAPIPAPVN